MKVVNNNSSKLPDLEAPATACAMWSKDTGCSSTADASCWWWSSDSCGATKDETGCSWGSTDTTAL